MLKKIYSKLTSGTLSVRERIRRGSETDKATRFWGELGSYHLSNDDDPTAIARSKWLAREILTLVSPSSVLEIGCNSGRNLKYIQEESPSVKLKGIDVNPRAIEYARSTKPGIQFELSDANNWIEPVDNWDCAITMSVTDHIPEEATIELARNIFRSCRAVIGVELWDGTSGKRALYKYSCDQRAVYESTGFTTLLWTRIPDYLQYDREKSPLWVYVGRR